MTDRFQFYSGSKDAIPGLGAGERKDRTDTDYGSLAKVPHWRKMLSNFWVAPFVWQGKRWNTVEHAFQAAKFQTLDPAFYHQMSLDSGSELSRSDGLTARKQRKHILLTGEQLAAWNSKSKSLLKELLTEKFTQDKTCQEVLLKTWPAELVHYAGRGQGVERWTDLEEFRARLYHQATATNSE
jgi:ribA/ribD-fused uncharacterized protein